MNTKWVGLFLSIFITTIGTPAFAQNSNDSSTTAEKKLKLIEVNFTTLGGLGYTLDGASLRGYKDFEELVYPLRDFEATRLLKKSENSDTKGKLFGLVGFVGLTVGIVGLLATPSNQQTPFWITAAGGAVIIDIGGLFETEAQTSKFNCVQRYNRFARGEEQILPQAPQDEKSLLPFDAPHDSSVKTGDQGN